MVSATVKVFVSNLMILRTYCDIADVWCLHDPVFLAFGVHEDTLEPSFYFRIPTSTPKHSSSIKVNLVFAKNRVKRSNTGIIV